MLELLPVLENTVTRMPGVREVWIGAEDIFEVIEVIHDYDYDSIGFEATRCYRFRVAWCGIIPLG